nr:Putative single strand-annealing protein [uncultured Mediterranean phage uvMED]
MKLNIYQKLHKAACEAGGVAKGKKVPGMQFNPLLHDSVQVVAMESLLNNGLYPVCTYTNYVKESFIMVTCSMKIHDIEDPKSHIDIEGCSAMGNLDKFGTGNGMSYAKKYAFLNALNLKTGLDNDDGYKAKPFNNIPQPSGTEHDDNHDAVAIEHIKNDMKNAKTIYQLRKLKNYKYKDAFTLAIKKHPAIYKDLNNIYETMETQLNTQGVTQ